MAPNKIATGKIIKLDEDKHLVFGWASIIKDVDGKILLDRQNDYIDSEEELEKAAYDYVLKSRDGGEMHIRRGVSKMVESVVLTEEKQRMLGIPAGSTPTGWWIGFKVNDDRVWEQVKKGEYAGFSVHGTGRRESTELPISKITEVGKGESAGHPFRGNQWTRGTSGGGSYAQTAQEIMDEERAAKDPTPTIKPQTTSARPKVKQAKDIDDAGKIKRVTARYGEDGSKKKVFVVMAGNPKNGKLAVVRNGTSGELFMARILGVNKKNKTFTAETTTTGGTGFYEENIPYSRLAGMIAGENPKRPNIKRG